MLLALDIGGTKVTIARFDYRDGALVMGEVSRYQTAHHAGLEDILAVHMGGRLTGLDGVGIGVAGPVLGRQVHLTNLPWIIDADVLEARFGAPVHLLNDLEAHGYAIPLVPPEHVVTLQAGRPKGGNRAMIAAGTGLGEALIFRQGAGFRVSPSEGGHTSFAPPTLDDLELLRFLLERYDHVSWERVVSGLDGFRNLYDFLSETGRVSVPSAFKASVEGHHDIGAQIIAAAAAHESFAETVLAWFVRLYGAEAGNLALKAMAVDGVYVAGGIALRILPYMQSGRFTAAFTAKGRFRPVLQDIPVHVLTDPYCALKGAAAYTHQQITGETPF